MGRCRRGRKWLVRPLITEPRGQKDPACKIERTLRLLTGLPLPLLPVRRAGPSTRSRTSLDEAAELRDSAQGGRPGVRASARGSARAPLRGRRPRRGIRPYPEEPTSAQARARPRRQPVREGCGPLPEAGADAARAKSTKSRAGRPTIGLPGHGRLHDARHPATTETEAETANVEGPHRKRWGPSTSCPVRHWRRIRDSNS